MDDLEPILRGMARRYANWRAPAEDLAQEGRLAVWQAQEGYDGHLGTFRAYALCRARGAMLHYLRDKSLLVAMPWRFDRGIGEDICCSLSGRETTLDFADGVIRRLWLEQILIQITERQRQALNLVYGEQMRYVEAARVVGVTPVAVKRLAERGLKRARRAALIRSF